MSSFASLVGCRLPLQQAAMGGVSGVRLACAVADAGGLGMLSGEGLSAEALGARLKIVRGMTRGVVGVNFLVPFLRDRRCVTAAARCARLVEFFWGEPDPDLVDLVHEGGGVALWQVGTVAEALAAEAAGCDAIVVQGLEAGGHVRGISPLPPFLEAVASRVSVPVLAAGGIGSCVTVADALKAGASGVRVGTRFIAAFESEAHPEYVAALISARAGDTAITETFSANWPNAPHRVLRSCIEAAQRGQKEIVGYHLGEDGARLPVRRFSGLEPTRTTSGEIRAMALYAGESVAHVGRRAAAAEIVEELMAGVTSWMYHTGSRRR